MAKLNSNKQRLQSWNRCFQFCCPGKGKISLENGAGLPVRTRYIGYCAVLESSEPFSSLAADRFNDRQKPALVFLHLIEGQNREKPENEVTVFAREQQVCILSDVNGEKKEEAAERGNKI